MGKRSFRPRIGALLNWETMLRFAIILGLLVQISSCSSNQSSVEDSQAEKLAAVADPWAAEPAGPPEESEPVVQPDTKASELDRWAPYFTIPPLKEALGAFLEGRNREAAQAFEAYAIREQGPRVLPARFLSLLAWHDAGVTDPTAQDLEALSRTWPLLADYCLYYAGSAHLKAGRVDDGFRVLGRIPKESSLYSRAAEKRAQAAARGGRLEAAIAVLRTLLKEDKRGRQESWALYGELLRRAGRGDASQAALVEALVRNPVSAQARGIRDALRSIKELAPKDNLRIGKAYQKRHLHKRAIKRLKAAAKGFARRSKSRCEALLGIGKTYEKMKKHKKAWKIYDRTLGCQGESRALATFWGGRNRLRAGKLGEAFKLLGAHLKEFPHRSTADDVQLLLSDLERERGNAPRAERLLFQSIKTYPQGDMADEASWSLLWPLISKGTYKRAERMARRLLEIPRRETKSGAEGRLRYWAGWIFSRRKKPAEAKKQFEKVIEEHPFSWYALMAETRLRALDPQGTKAFMARRRGNIPSGEKLGDSPELVASDPHFLRARELSRMGLFRSAKREMDFMSKEPPVQARRWAKARLFSEGHFYARAAGMARPALRRLGKYWPGGKAKELWKMAFPKAYADTVEHWATQNGLDPYWIWSVMRTESNFNPTVKSWAGAHGLMQIIVPTAKRLARKTGIKVSVRSLQEPAVSIRLGAKYLAKLKRRHPVTACASVGYNAGGGAVKKWRKKFGDLPLDQWVETIPYAEARRYAKRVVSTRAIYRWLYEGELPSLRLDPPGAP